MDMSLLHRRECIIISTIEAINRVGIQNLSTKIIAQQEGVSEGTLFRHFKSKTEIMIAVLEHFTQFDDAIIESCLNKKTNVIDVIRNFMMSYAEYYENYPEITALVQSYDSLMFDKNLAEMVTDITKKRSNFIIDTLNEGKNQGIIKSEIITEDVEDAITGGSRNICVKWRMENYKFSLKKRTLSMLDTILNKIVIDN